MLNCLTTGQCARIKLPMEKRKVLEQVVVCKAALGNSPIREAKAGGSRFLGSRPELFALGGQSCEQHSRAASAIAAKGPSVSVRGLGSTIKLPRACCIPEDAPAAGPNFRCCAISWERAKAEGETSHRPHQKSWLNQLLFLPWILTLLSHQHYCKLQEKGGGKKKGEIIYSLPLTCVFRIR